MTSLRMIGVDVAKDKLQIAYADSEMQMEVSNRRAARCV